MLVNVKALVGAFNQEKAIVRAFSMIVQLRVIFGNLRFKLYSQVSAQHVVTAAHCTHGHTAASIEVLVGEHDTSDSTAARHNVSAITNHPSYNHSSLDFDFSILTLEAPINISTAAAPVCLPASLPLYTGSLATVTGWGLTSEGGSGSPTLREGNVTIVSNEQCTTSYGSRINRSVLFCCTLK